MMAADTVAAIVPVGTDATRATDAVADRASTPDATDGAALQADTLVSTAAATFDTAPPTESVLISPSASTSATAWTDTSTRERIAGSPLVPDCVKWAEDGRVAVVSDASIMISTFMSRELEMYIQQGPTISKSYIFLPTDTSRERVPISIPVFSEPTDSTVAPGSMTNFLLYEADRHQHNPKELSLSKSEGKAFVAATWGPRGSGPNASCALLTLTCASRVALHFASSFRMSWREVAVLSESLFAFLDRAGFRMQHKSRPSPKAIAKPAKGSKKRRRATSASTRAPKALAPESTSMVVPVPVPAATTTTTNSVAEYAHKCALLATLSIAWSPFVLASDGTTTTSLIALCGRKIATVWSYEASSFVGAEPAADAPLVSAAPVAWIDTERFGWITTTAWQLQCVVGSDERSTAPMQTLTLVMGTTAGNVLLAHVPVLTDTVDTGGFPLEVAVHRSVVAPHCQPVFSVSLGALGDASCAMDLVVASGSTLSVWRIDDDDNAQTLPQLTKSWRAHAGNVTGLGVSYFGDTIFSCGVDGAFRAWDKQRGTELPFRSTTTSTSSGSSSGANTNADASKYPLFGLAVSPSSAQLACVHIIPPAARPNRKSQADVSYSRVSSALEYVAAPSASDATRFVDAMCRVLDTRGSASAFADVLWFCHDDNAALTSLRGSAELTIPHLLDRLRGVSRSHESAQAREPLYLSLCNALECKYADATAAAPAKPTLSSSAPDTNTLNTASAAGATGALRPPGAAIRYLQASYLLRSCIPPAENHVAVRNAALVQLQRTLLSYWAERCLTTLVATFSHAANFAGLSSTERISALLMADFLSIQTPLSARCEQLVTSVYTRLGSDDNNAQWLAYVQQHVECVGPSDNPTPSPTPPTPPTPPARQTCFICDQPVPFSEFTLVCVSGHAQERCFLSFQVLASLDAWRCLGCGASACAIDVSTGTSPFFLLESQLGSSCSSASRSSDGGAKITCRLCGNFCSFLTY